MKQQMNESDDISIDEDDIIEDSPRQKGKGSIK